MRSLPSRKSIGWIACLLAFQIPALAQKKDEQDIAAANHPETAPDEELLEFLAEFGDATEETFEAIIHHGVNDASMTAVNIEKRASHE